MDYYLKYYAEFYSSPNEHLYRLEIHSKTQGTPEEIILGPNRVQITREKRGDSINVAYKSSEASIEIYSDQTLKYTPLFDIKPLSLMVRILKDGNLYWQGYTRFDTYEEPYVGGGFLINLKAYDGLGFLKNTPFLDANGNRYTNNISGKRAYIELLKYALSSLKPLLLFNSLANLYEDGMANEYNQEPLSQVYLDLNKLYEMLPECTCEDVINIVCKPFGQLRQWEGKWWLVPYRNLCNKFYGMRTWDLDSEYNPGGSNCLQLSSQADVELAVEFTTAKASKESRLCFIPDPTLEILPPIKELNLTVNNGQVDNAYKVYSPYTRTWEDNYNNLIREKEHVWIWGIPQGMTPEEANRHCHFKIPIHKEEKKINFSCKITVDYYQDRELEKIKLSVCLKGNNGIYYNMYKDNWLVGKYEKVYGEEILDDCSQYTLPEYTLLNLEYDKSGNYHTEFDFTRSAKDIPVDGELIFSILDMHGDWQSIITLREFKLTIDGYGEQYNKSFEYETLGIENEDVELTISDLTDNLNDHLFSTCKMLNIEGQDTRAWRQMPALGSLSLRQHLVQNFEQMMGLNSTLMLSGKFLGYLNWVGIVRDKLDLNTTYFINSMVEDLGNEENDAELLQVNNYEYFKGEGTILTENYISFELEDETGYILLEQAGTEEPPVEEDFVQIIDAYEYSVENGLTYILDSTLYQNVVYYIKKNYNDYGYDRIFYINSNYEEAILLTTYGKTIKQIYGHNGVNPKLVFCDFDDRVFYYNVSEGLVEINKGTLKIKAVWAADNGAIYMLSDTNPIGLYEYKNNNITLLFTLNLEFENVTYTPRVKEVIPGVAVIYINNYNLYKFYITEYLGVEIPNLLRYNLNGETFESWAAVYSPNFQDGIHSGYKLLIRNEVGIKDINTNTYPITDSNGNKAYTISSCKFGTKTYLGLGWNFNGEWPSYYDWSKPSKSRVISWDLNDPLNVWHLYSNSWLSAEINFYNKERGHNMLATDTEVFRISKCCIWKLN